MRLLDHIFDGKDSADDNSIPYIPVAPITDHSNSSQIKNDYIYDLNCCLYSSVKTSTTKKNSYSGKVSGKSAGFFGVNLGMADDSSALDAQENNCNYYFCKWV